MSKKYDKIQEFKSVVGLGSSELLFKFLIVGDYGVGKTSIVKRYTDGSFTSNYKITIGADFAIKTFLWNNTKINLQLWDIAGHERFGYLTRVYYKYAVAAAIVFDLTRMQTFEAVEKWISDLRSKVSLPNGEELPVIVLANKCDIVSAIPTVDMKALCEKFNILAWFMTSAKENSNIDEAFNFLIQRVIENREFVKNDTNDNIILSEENIVNINPKKKSCCG